jgi:hypothetical protein
MCFINKVLEGFDETTSLIENWDDSKFENCRFFLAQLEGILPHKLAQMRKYVFLVPILLNFVFVCYSYLSNEFRDIYNIAHGIIMRALKWFTTFLVIKKKFSHFFTLGKDQCWLVTWFGWLEPWVLGLVTQNWIRTGSDFWNGNQNQLLNWIQFWNQVFLKGKMVY